MYQLKTILALLAICLCGAACSKPAKVLPESEQYPRPSEEGIRQSLNEMQFKVTQQDGTEPPFKNAYWDQKSAGIYVDVVSGEPLFSSREKFKSGTGWPSFWQPLVADHVVQQVDRTLATQRQEVRSRYADSHLGHVFEDGPAPTGLRYCINSAALRFIPVAALESEGYPEYLPLFTAESTPLIDEP